MSYWALTVFGNCLFRLIYQNLYLKIQALFIKFFSKGLLNNVRKLFNYRFFVTFLKKRQIETNGLFIKFLSKQFAKMSSIIFKYFFATYPPKPVIKITSIIHKNSFQTVSLMMITNFSIIFFATCLPKRQTITKCPFIKFSFKRFFKRSFVTFQI